MTSFDIVIERNGSEYKRYTNVTSPFHFTPTESGDYLALGIARNSYGATEGNRRKFYVNSQSPLNVGMICNRENSRIATGTDVEFGFWGTYVTTFNIIIERNGTFYKQFNNVKSPFHFVPTEAGDYLTYGVAYNEDGSTDANRRKFYVYSLTPSTSTTATRSDGAIEVQTTISNLTESAQCVMAVYSSDGKLLGQSSTDVDSRTNSTTAYFPNYPNASYVKVFLWDSLQGMKPLTNGEKVNIQ